MKEEILAISLKQFLKYGIRKMTIKKLVAPLGISTKTVYKYFSNKEDLLKQCLNLHYGKLTAEFVLLKEMEENPVIALFQTWQRATQVDFGANHIFYHDLNYYFPKLQDDILEKQYKKYNNWFEEIITAGVSQGYLRKDIIPKVAIESIRVIYTAITRTPSYNKFKLAPATLIQNTIEVFLRGLCTDKGLKFIQQYYSTILE